MFNPKHSVQAKVQPIVVATAYDFPFANLLEEAGVDIILVGDSLANVVLGFPSTRDVGMIEMELFTAAVIRGAPNTHIVADMPAGSYVNSELALQNAQRFMTIGATSVKLEGPLFATVKVLTDLGIPVMGHLGVLPQTATSFRPVGRTQEMRESLIQEAMGLEAAGAFAIVLENVDFDSAAAITQAIAIPTIGIGSGPRVSGQVQVLHDLLGLSKNPPPFAKAFARIREEALGGLKAYVAAVRYGNFL